MNPCNLDFETLNAYADGALGPERELQVRRHLDGCDRCTAVVESLTGLKQVVAAAAEIRPVPHSLRENVMAMAARPRPRRSKRAYYLVPALAAAVLVGVFLTLRSVRNPPPSEIDSLSAALLSDHLRYMALPDAIQVASDDPARIAASFQNQVRFPIRLPRFRRADLLGARLCWLKGHKAVLTFYEDAGKRFSLFVFGHDAAAPELPSDVPTCRTSGRFEVCLVREEPLLLALVAESAEARGLLSQLRPGALAGAPPALD